jgi:hypothetical protein
MNKIYKAALIISGILAFQNFCFSMMDLHNYGGHDGWSLVMGVRLLLDGKNPYDLTLYPSRMMVPSNTPFVLMVYSLLCTINYKLQRYFYGVLEWVCLGVSLWLLVRHEKDETNKKILLLIGLVFFAASRFWRVHVELGQRYVYLLLLCTLGYVNMESKLLSSLIFGAVAAFRPNYILIAAAFWALRRRWTALLIVLSSLLWVSLTFPLGGLTAWTNYDRFVEAYERDLTAYNFHGAISPDPASFAHEIKKEATPVLFDGVNVTPYLEGRPFETISVTFLQVMQFRRFKNWASTLDLIFLNKILLCGAVGLMGLFYSFGNQIFSSRKMLLMALTLCLVSDFFVPVHYGYADVFLLLPIALALPYMNTLRWTFLLAGLCFGSGFALNSDSGSLFTLLRSPLLVLSFLGAIFYDARSI